MYTPVNPKIDCIKVGFKGDKIIQACFRDGVHSVSEYVLLKWYDTVKYFIFFSTYTRI